MLNRISNLEKMVFLVLPLIMVNNALLANPTGGQVAAGVAQIVKTSPQRLDIVQQSNRAALNWQSFNINANEHVNFQQPSSQSSTLNRVMGQDPSAILGRLTANGKVFLLNPNGILFGKQAKIDVGGLVAATANIKNADFMAGRLQFDAKVNNGMVVNQGQINAKDNGLVALVAPGVNNSGVINAKLGRVVLVSGRKFALDLYGDNLIKLAVDDSVVNQVQGANGQPVKAFVNHSGEINAEGGKVILATGTAKQAVDHVVNMNGVIRAQSASQRNGKIILSAGSQGKAQVNGLLDASGLKPGQTGGVIQVLGKQVNLGGKARLNASGQSGGGNILVGGDYQGKGKLITAQTTMINQGSRINADALTQGNGGKVIVWADGNTQFHGAISAKGGRQSGNGGFAEVSGKKNLIYRGDTVLSARHGQAGTLLLDPTNIIVGKTGKDTLNTNDSTIKASTISETLGKGTSVKLLADNDISVNADIDSRYQDAPSGARLDLNAGNNVNLNANILTKNGAITATATNGNITMAKDKILFAGNQDINLTAGKGINAQHLLTSGDVKLTANAGNIELKQALGGAVDKHGKPLFKLAALTATANLGEVKLNGIDATSDIKITAQKNINVDGPINTSGGGITLTSKGSNADQSAINLNHNLYTNGKDIILDGDVLINPTAKELVSKVKEKTQFGVDCSSKECRPSLCPTCDFERDNNGQPIVSAFGPFKVLKVDTNYKNWRFTDLVGYFEYRGELGNVLVRGYKSTDTLKEANERVEALSKILSLREITIDSKGGDVIFKGALDRYSGKAKSNFEKLLSQAANPGHDHIIFNSYVNHGLTVSAGNGNVIFEKKVGNKEIYDISHSFNNDPRENGGAIGSFHLFIPTAKSVNFKDDVLINNLTYNGKDIVFGEIFDTKVKFDKKNDKDPNFPNTPDNCNHVCIFSAPFSLNNSTVYSSTPDSPNKIDYSGLGGVKLGFLPLHGVGVGGNGGGGGSSTNTGNSILSQVQVAQRNETCKKFGKQDDANLIKTTGQSHKGVGSVAGPIGKVINTADKQISSNNDCNQKVNKVRAEVNKSKVMSRKG